MALALTNLDSGLFLEESGWTADLKLAQRFEDGQTLLDAAIQNKVKNAAAVILDGDPPRAAGYLWVTGLNSN